MRGARGRRGLAGLAVAVTADQFYAVFQRELGHGTSCTLVMPWLRTGDPTQWEGPQMQPHEHL